MYTLQQSTNFGQRVDLGNSYCNCFHLMCRIGKITWYIPIEGAKKSVAHMIHRVVMFLPVYIGLQ